MKRLKHCYPTVSPLMCAVLKAFTMGFFNDPKTKVSLTDATDLLAEVLIESGDLPKIYAAMLKKAGIAKDDEDAKGLGEMYARRLQKMLEGAFDL